MQKLNFLYTSLAFFVNTCLHIHGLFHEPACDLLLHVFVRGLAEYDEG